MKKIIVCILTFVLSAQLLCPVYAQTQDLNETKTYPYKEAALLELIGIKIIPEEEYLNRGEFAAMVSVLLGGVDKTNIAESSFGDISSYYLYKNEVEIVKNHGLMTGYNGMFEPVKKITLQEAVKVLVSLAGYDDYAMRKGGYPGGYIQIANMLKWLKGVKTAGNEFITMDVANHLIFKLLETPIYEITSLKNPDSWYYEQSDETYGKKFFGIKEVSGLVAANHASALSGYESAPENQVMIDDKLYFCGVSGISEMLGQQVDVYVREINGDDEKCQIIYCEISDDSISVKADKKDILKVLGFDAQDPIKYKRNPEIEFLDEDGRNETVKMGGDLQVAYNGVITTDITNDDFKNNYGYVEFIDTDGNGEYDFISITNYISYVVDFFDIGNKRLVFKYGEGNFTLGDQKVVSVSSDKRTVDFASIVPDMAVSVRTSLLGAGETMSDSEVIYFDLSSKKIKGKIESIVKDDNIVVVDGEAYEYTENVEAEFIIGETFDFYVDVLGIICGVERINLSEAEYYFFISHTFKAKLKSELKLQFIDMNGKETIFETGEKTVYTGPDKEGNWVIKAKYEKEEIAEILSSQFDGRFLFKLVVEDGKLLEIIAPKKGYTEPVYEGYSDEFSLDRRIEDKAAHDYCLDDVYRFNSNTTVILNNVLGSVEEIKITKTTEKLNASNIEYIDIYDAKDSLYAGVIVVHISESSSSDSKEWSAWERSIFVVDTVTQKLNSEGVAVYTLNGYSNGQYISYLCDDAEIKDNYTNSPYSSYGYKNKVEDLSCGDLVILDLNNSNEVTGFMSLLTFNGSSIPTGYRFSMGNGNDWGAILATYYDSVEHGFDRTFTLKGNPSKIFPMRGTFYLCDLTKNTVEKMELTEVYGLLKDAESAYPDYAFVRQRRSDQIETILYRR